MQYVSATFVSQLKDYQMRLPVFLCLNYWRETQLGLLPEGHEKIRHMVLLLWLTNKREVHFVGKSVLSMTKQREARKVSIKSMTFFQTWNLLIFITWKISSFWQAITPEISLTMVEPAIPKCQFVLC